MGGCASKPKGMDLNATQVPATPKNQPQPETISQGNDNGGESQKENAAPLVDLSESNEPKQEAGGDPASASAVAPSKPAEPEAVPAPEPAQVPALTPDLTQAEKVEAIAKGSEDKTEATVHTQTKEGQPKTDTVKSDPTPTSEDKTVAPLVAV